MIYIGVRFRDKFKSYGEGADVPDAIADLNARCRMHYQDRAFYTEINTLVGLAERENLLDFIISNSARDILLYKGPKK